MKSVLKRRSSIIHGLLFMLICMVASPTFSQDLQNYKLSADDVISINVFDEPDLSVQSARVSSSGTVSLPLIGQVRIKGLEVVEAESEIRKKYLDGYLKKPDISIRIIEYRQFYVNGEVGRPGGYNYREGMTIQRAITLAGGFTERASRSSISLVREGGMGKETTQVNLSTPVKPGDVITVEQSFF